MGDAFNRVSFFLLKPVHNLYSVSGWIRSIRTRLDVCCGVINLMRIRRFASARCFFHVFVNDAMKLQEGCCLVLMCFYV